MLNSRFLRAFVFGVLCISLSTPLQAAKTTGLNWQDLTEQNLAAAQKSERLVYVYVEAVWCHWCHVMQQTTLADPAVISYLEQHFVAVRVDHDAQPDIADRYRAWGWPANVFMTATGEELVLRAGYIEPDDFLRLLKAIVADPSAERSADLSAPAGRGEQQLPASIRDELVQRHVTAYDGKNAGLKSAQKFLDRHHVEWAMYQAQHGDKAAAARAQQTLNAALQLFDPAWGGVYQYSTGGRWDRAHYEKLLRIQAAYLKIYALASKQWPAQKQYAVALGEIHRYVDEHLRSPDGSVYNSQDADLEPGEKAHGFFALSSSQRSSLGSPRVDASRYVLGNAEWVSALCEAYAATGNRAWFDEAERLGDWLLMQRDQGLFGRGPDGPEGFFFADNVAAVQALLSLYRISADRRWIDAAVASASMISNHFKRVEAGYLPVQHSPLNVAPQLQDNIRAARTYNVLHQYTGVQSHRDAAVHAMRYLSLASVALARIEESGILLANDELSRPADHLSVVGESTMQAEALFQAALGTPGSYQRIDWLRPSAPTLLRNEVEYPQLNYPAAYVCSENRCSLPSASPEQFNRRIKAILFSEAVD